MSDVTGTVRAVCMALPSVTERLSHGTPAFFVGKQFLLLWSDGHHEDHFAHLWCAAPLGMQEALVATAPDRFFVPPYVGGRGWVGMRLDGPFDQEELRTLCEDAFRTVAPRKVLAQLDAGR